MSELDFLDESPATPNPTVTSSPAGPVTSDTAILPVQTRDERVAMARAEFNEAETALKLAKHRLQEAERVAVAEEPEISLAERNAESRRIDQALSADHRAAVKALQEMGVDVARVVREGVKPKGPRKTPPQFFKS